MNYYEIIYLKKELKNKLTSSVLELAITPYRNLLELFMSGEQESFRLIFSTAPGNIALFADTYRPAKKSNTLQFFEEVYQVPITGVEVAHNDRFLSITFENGYTLWFRMFSNKANALLTKDGVIAEAFKSQDEVGEAEPSPRSKELFPDSVSGKNTKELMIRLNGLLPRSELNSLIELNGLDNKSESEVSEFTKSVTEQLLREPHFRKLKTGTITLIDKKHLPVETDKEFTSANDLVSYRFKNYSHDQRLKQQKSSYIKTLKRQMKRDSSALNNLEKADKGVEKADSYEKIGHLLMANAHLGKPASEKITVNDLYDHGKEIELKVDQELSIAENAEQYYKRSANALRSYEEALERIPVIRKKKERIGKMLEEVTAITDLRDMEDWKKKYKKQLDDLGFGKKQKDENTLPFHTLKIGDYQIWIGKNAKSNDKLVQYSHKEDIWMHARGVPGSHLVIRMANNKNMPQKNIIEEAASYAAYNSKAKGAELVPVIFTKKKYVRKPKGAAPGAVLVQKEEVELVKPKKPVL